MIRLPVLPLDTAERAARIELDRLKRPMTVEARERQLRVARTACALVAVARFSAEGAANDARR